MGNSDYSGFDGLLHCQLSGFSGFADYFSGTGTTDYFFLSDLCGAVFCAFLPPPTDCFSTYRAGLELYRYLVGIYRITVIGINKYSARLGFCVSSAIIFSFFIMGSGVMVALYWFVRFTAYTMTVASLATLTHFAFHHDLVLTVTAIPLDVYNLSLMMLFLPPYCRRF